MSFSSVCWTLYVFLCSISPLFSDDDNPKYEDYDLPKYDFSSSGSPLTGSTNECDGIEREMLDIAIERSLQSEECSQQRESVRNTYVKN